MEKLMMSILAFILEIDENIEELYRDDEFYNLVLIWGIILVVIAIVFLSAIYLAIKKNE